MSAALHRHTPKLSVIDGRGLPVRQVDYLRIFENDEPQADITRQRHDAAGRAVAQWDPRLFGKMANLTSVYNLSAIPLLTDSVDSGWRLNLPGEAGQSLQRWDQRGSGQQTDYDLQLRPTAIHEQASEQAKQTVERFTYGDSSPDSARHNQCGRLIRHYDPAGGLFIDEYGLTGSALQQTRRFLKEPDLPNWPETPQEQENWLETAKYPTKWYYNAVGDMLDQTDAKEHRQHLTFDVAGQLKTIHLQLKDATDKQAILESLQYNAAGQVETQTTGNGVISTAVFHPPDGRLNELKAAEGGMTHQHLGYEYDPVGNVTTISDHTHVIRYFANQRVDGARTFTYDSLYQLKTATGYESIGASTQPDLPGLITPIDLSTLGNYTQTYEYDSGKNLTKLTHVSSIPGQGHTRTLKIAEHSNRCLSWQKGDSTPLEMDFDEDGNLQTLQPAGQALLWNPRNQLQRVTQVSREDGEDDLECYAYDGKGNRLRKRQSAKARSVTHVREVRYLSGLEVRTLDDSEELHVITLQAGRSNVRCLHWVKGKPPQIDNDQLRYSLDDHLGSCCLELDKDAAIISHEGYYPFGVTAWWAARSRVDADYKTIRYSGKERDTSGLYYYGFRYYAPWLGRWISPDPAGTSDGLNLYRFCGNNPTCRVDPDGRMWQQPDDVLDDFVKVEADLRAEFGLPPIVLPATEQDDDESMDYQDSPASSQGHDSEDEASPGSPGSPENPASPTPDQDTVLEILNRGAPQLRYDWNTRNLLSRENFGGKVFRADQREPDEVARDGFRPSDEFTGVKKMISGDALIVAETLEGALFYAAQGSRPYYFYEIDATDVGGASLLENLILNTPRMLAHLEAELDVSPSNQTGLANRMHEAHLNFDDLTLHGRPVVSLGQLPNELEHMRRTMNL